MTDDATTPAATATADAAPGARRCAWCSELLPVDATDRCPHCNANLVAEGDARVPGLTEVFAPSTTKARIAEPAKRSKLLSWISGEVDDSLFTKPATPEAVALPPRDVRREMLRIRLESEGLTVTADGSIELPADATSPTAVPTDGPPADAAAASEPLGEVRKAS